MGYLAWQAGRRNGFLGVSVALPETGAGCCLSAAKDLFVTAAVAVTTATDGDGYD